MCIALVLIKNDLFHLGIEISGKAWRLSSSIISLIILEHHRGARQTPILTTSSSCQLYSKPNLLGAILFISGKPSSIFGVFVLVVITQPLLCHSQCGTHDGDRDCFVAVFYF